MGESQLVEEVGVRRADQGEAALLCESLRLSVEVYPPEIEACYFKGVENRRVPLHFILQGMSAGVEGVGSDDETVRTGKLFYILNGLDTSYLGGGEVKEYYVAPLNGEFHAGDEEYPPGGSVLFQRLTPGLDVVIGNGKAVKTEFGGPVDKLLPRMNDMAVPGIGIGMKVKVRFKLHKVFRLKGQASRIVNKKSPQPVSAGGSFFNPAASYSPTQSPTQYHRPWRT